MREETYRAPLNIRIEKDVFKSAEIVKGGHHEARHTFSIAGDALFND